MNYYGSDRNQWKKEPTEKEKKIWWKKWMNKHRCKNCGSKNIYVFLSPESLIESTIYCSICKIYKNYEKNTRN